MQGREGAFDELSVLLQGSPPAGNFLGEGDGGGVLQMGAPALNGSLIFGFQAGEGFHQRIDFRLRHISHCLYQIPDSPGIDLPTQLPLNLHLVALGDRNLPHIVAKAHDLHFPGYRNANGSPHPISDTPEHIRILPIACDDLPRCPKPCRKEAMLPVAMGCLIQIHEIHVNLLVGNLLVVLGGKMAVGLLKFCHAVNPHLGRAEGMAPGDNSRTGIIIVCLLDDLGNLSIAHGCDLINQWIWEPFTHLCSHFRSTPGNRFQNLLAIQIL